MTFRPPLATGPGRLALRSALALALLGPHLFACAPIVRPASFKGARGQVTDTSLLGPFDGQIVDQATGEPVQDAVVVGVWSYDRGDGFISPSGSETISVQTDEAGRYRIGRAPLRKRGSHLRLVSFRLVVYKRGYASYRSDALLAGGPRRDFTGRHNRIELDKWRERDSHADHLLFLAPPREVARVADWERRQANLDLYKTLGGGLEPEDHEGEGDPRGPDGPGTPEDLWLDASQLIYPEDVAMRTGYDGEFVVEDLGDFPRTDFYHGVLFRALDREEEHDFSYRVWHQPSGGLEPVIAIFRENLPVEVSPEVTDETWIYEEPGTEFRGVAFIDRASETGVLVSCGPAQCIDVDTAIILAKYIQGRLEQISTVPAGPAPEPAAAEPSATSGDASPAPSEPEPEPEPDSEPEPEPDSETPPEPDPDTEPQEPSP
ncbi:carboxypeptidase-like regulatory domain-containing protein [Enhygromyxa salina]|uniref:carboxypeptidase-like regulatory domain-containing protein n=1 Tax=Enhygromyxa salina TaxID=215803 RepID=UPI0015E608E7|nr:carboxypeptidase-like regulatory domain-containing protein [Enhygromyxa salina]